jgi:hypothetical protein
MDIFFTLLLFTAGFLFGWLAHAMYMVKRMIEDPARILKTVKDLQDIRNIQEKEIVRNEVRNVKVEKHGNRFYLYDEETDDFLAYGDSLEEALELVNLRFPDKKFQGHLTKEQVDSLEISIKQ